MKKKKDKNDYTRITEIVSEQKKLIEEFSKSGDTSLVGDFKKLIAEFQQIHKAHQFGLPRVK